MTHPENRPEAAAHLRRQAEERARNQADAHPETLSPAEIRQALHELRVHQIELEIQNEELRRSQAELDAARERYFDLYDLAPVGYLTLSAQGLIQEANLTAAGLLGVPRGALVQQPLSRFIVAADQEIYYRHRQQLFESGEPQNCDLRLLRSDGMEFWAHLSATAAQDPGGAPVCRASLSDISARKQAENALLESKERALRSEARLMKAQTVARVGDWIWDLKENHVEWSDEMYHIFGIDKNSYAGRLGDVIARVIHPDDLHLVLPSNAPTFAQKKPVEYRILWPDGSIRHIWAESGDAILDEAGQPIFLTGIAQDVTERKLQEEVQAYLARTSAGLADGSFFPSVARFLAQCLGMDYVCIDRLEGDGLNARTLAVWCDGQFEDNVSYALKDTPCGEVVGQTVCCFPASVCQFFPRDLVLQDLRAESYVGVTLFDHAGRPIGLIAVISRRPLVHRAQVEALMQTVGLRAAAELERLDAEQVLKTSEEKFRTLTSLVPVGVYLTDPDGNCDYANPAWLKMAGLSLEQALGNGWLAGIYPDDREKVMGNWQKMVESRGKWNLEYRFRSPDGKITQVLGLATAQTAVSGKVIGYVGVNIDITERKQAEARINEQLEELKRWYHATMGREERIMELKREVNKLLAEAGKPPHYASVVGTAGE